MRILPGDRGRDYSGTRMEIATRGFFTQRQFTGGIRISLALSKMREVIRSETVGDLPLMLGVSTSRSSKQGTSARTWTNLSTCRRWSRQE
ncbi:hypothetical protein LINGRAHAP2_LOCUS19933 [Linum grandiflorum]